METIFDIEKIMSLLPHRYPFLLVDRVLELEPGKRLKALKNVTINEPFFVGHFPSAPIMPGVLIVEAMAQAGGVLVFASAPPEVAGRPIYFMAIDKVRFRRPVVPGDQLIFSVEIIKQRSKAVKLAGSASVDGQLVAEAEMMASMGEP
ncbi:MAG: 3-hydroxyacyl-ACP dehydratase FabZ [Desulfobacterales bacterium]|jgi:beta-hydroxyacyl-ACP dehydratase FabZ